MGQAISRRYDSLFSQISSTVLLLSLDAAGKTTLLYHLGPDLNATYSSLYSSIETAQLRNITFVCWDGFVGAKYSVLLRHYCQATKAVIYIVHSNERDTVKEVRDTLECILEIEELIGMPLLVLGISRICQWL